MSDPTGVELDEERDAEARVEAHEDDLGEDMGALEQKDERVVRWYGQPGVDYREISVDEWRKAGVSIDDDADVANTASETGRVVQTVRWDKSNDFSVPLSALDFLTEGQVARYIHGDGRFRIEG